MKQIQNLKPVETKIQYTFTRAPIESEEDSEQGESELSEMEESRKKTPS
jgi:hypothetical protein